MPTWAAGPCSPGTPLPFRRTARRQNRSGSFRWRRSTRRSSADKARNRRGSYRGRSRRTWLRTSCSRGTARRCCRTACPPCPARRRPRTGRNTQHTAAPNPYRGNRIAGSNRTPADSSCRSRPRSRTACSPSPAGTARFRRSSRRGKSAHCTRPRLPCNAGWSTASRTTCSHDKSGISRTANSKYPAGTARSNRSTRGTRGT